MENFGQVMPVSAVPFLTALLQRQQVFACFFDFRYSTMVCLIDLVLQSMVLSYTPDREHILEIAMCSKNKQSLYEVLF